MTSRRSARLIASNLHVGGGVQVAASLVNELNELLSDGEVHDLLLEVSPSVEANLDPAARQRLNTVVCARRPLTLRYLLSDLRRRDDVTFVVFGPTYFPIRSRRRVFGYADVTAVCAATSEVTMVQQVGALRRGYLFVARPLSRRWAARADVLVVETAAMAANLQMFLGRHVPR